MDPIVSHSEQTLTIDFGQVGRWGSQSEAFCLQLDASPIDRLIAYTAVARCIPELYAIQRPGDLLDAIWVHTKQVPARLAARIEFAREDYRNSLVGNDYPWPADHMPFNDFDALIERNPDDADDFDESWLSFRDSPQLHEFISDRFTECQNARAALNRSQPIFEHVCRLLESGQHPSLFESRSRLSQRALRLPPLVHDYSQSFLDRLAQQLANPDLDSVSYSGDGNLVLYYILASEQRRRCTIKGVRPRDALFLSALTDNQIRNSEWDSEIFWRTEGITYGELYIQDRGVIGSTSFSRHGIRFLDVLSIIDFGEMDGFSRTAGDGWFHYQNLTPPTRAERQELLATWRD